MPAPQPLLPALARPFFRARPALCAPLRRGDVAGVVRLLGADPALALALSWELRALQALPRAQREAAEPTLRVLIAACTLYTDPSPAVSP